MTTSNHPKDLRTWIDELKAAGELIRIDKPVDPLTQMGSLLYQSREKALFFEQLPHGWRSLGQAPANVRHAAIAFGVSQEALIPTVAERMGKNIPPVMVDDGPVKEMKFKQGEFDLTKLPVHVAGQRDGGPVIGSGRCGW
jgi:UbiD family decarboxylase